MRAQRAKPDTRYNVARQMVDGLGHGGSDAETDFSTIAYELRQLGYNTVRLPFRYRDLDYPYPKDYSVSCWSMSQDDLKKRLLEPGAWTHKSLPWNPAQMPKSSGQCNTYLPSSSTYDRMMYTIQSFISQGMYVILDYQPMNTEFQANNVAEFTCKWRNLVSRVVSLYNWDTDIRGRLIIDIMNEPDSMGLAWEPANGKPGARELYISVMDNLYSLSRDLLFMVEGAGQSNFGLNWGNGFITDYNIIKRYGLSDANDFFQLLVGKAYWDKTKGYCQGTHCVTFPVVVGETGSFMADQRDTQWLLDFADFLQAKGGARAYNWIPAAGWLWWCYNENSGDTGGIIWNNWSQLDWKKLRYMKNNLDLKLWYLAP
eukprot:gene12217-12355_t